MKVGNRTTGAKRSASKDGEAVGKALSRKEREVMRCFASGMTIYTAANELGVSPHTVDTYARRIYGKFRVHSRAAAVAVYLRQSACRPPVL